MAASPARTPDIRYSDVARYVGLSLMKDTAHRPKSQVRLHPLKAQEVAAARALPSPPSGGTRDEQADKVKTQLSWLKAQQRAEKEELRRLEGCLSDSMLLEKKAQRKAMRDKEKFEYHQRHAEQMEGQIQALQAQLRQKAEAQRPMPLSVEEESPSQMDRPKSEEAQPELPVGRSQTAPPERQIREKHVPIPAVREEEPEVAEDTHMTLKEYWDAADQRREKDKEAKQVRSQVTSASGRSQADMRRSNTSSQLLRRKPQLSSEEIAQNHEEYRRTIRQLLVDKCGCAKDAFKKLDLNGSGNISLQEFADGVARLGINWQEMTGLHRPRELFKIFDLDKDGVITFAELFPEVEEKEPERVTTPEFWKRWVRRNRDLENTRDPKWQPRTPEAELELLFSTSEKHEQAAELRKWMAATIHRLKNRGKSDARCREIVAAHLPRGTGPKDREDVQTFSSAEVKSCKKDYNDKVNDPVRNIQKVVYDMREQRRVLHDSRQKLWSLTMEPVMRKQLDDDRKSAAAVVGLSLGIAKEGEPASQAQHAPAKKSSKLIAQQCKMDEDTVDFLHKEFAAQADKADLILKKGFQRLLRSLCPGRTISESDGNYWWDQAVKGMPPQEDTRKAQACDFERFVGWYATSEARTV
ncbi:unnamed protein product [Effrenium voratum]|nr:unnamed protein product [Effrenium voratum]